MTDHLIRWSKPIDPDEPSTCGVVEFDTPEEAQAYVFNYEYHRINCDCDACKAWWADASQ